MNSKEKEIVLNEIIKTFQEFKHKSLVRCPNCEKVIEWQDANYNPAESIYTCPKCLHEINEYEFEQISIVDYLEEIYLAYLTQEQLEKGDFEICDLHNKA